MVKYTNILSAKIFHLKCPIGYRRPDTQVSIACSHVTISSNVFSFLMCPLKTGHIMVWRCPSGSPSLRPSVTLMIMTVSVHFLSDGLIDSDNIWYTDVSWRDAGQVPIWLLLDLAKLLPLDLKKLLQNDSFRSFSQWWYDGFKGCLVYRCIMKRCRSSSNMNAGRLHWRSYCPWTWKTS
jgi:hypothetical protein